MVLYASDPETAWLFFDVVVASLLTDEENAKISRNRGSASSDPIGMMTEGWAVASLLTDEENAKISRNRGSASSDPIGMMTEGWARALASQKLPAGEGIPRDFKVRLDRLLSSPFEDSDIVSAIISTHINQLHEIAPTWVMESIVPWFSFKHPFAESAWNGYLSYLSEERFLPKEIGRAIKPHLLNAFPSIYRWNWRNDDLATMAVNVIVSLAIFRAGGPDGITLKEARHCIRRMNPSNREDVISRLQLIGERKNGWRDHVIPFIEGAWPRERRYRTTQMMSEWGDLLVRTEEAFPQMLKCIRPFLVPVESESYWLSALIYAGEDEEAETIAKKYPRDVLDLLEVIVPGDHHFIPYELVAILQNIKLGDARLEKNGKFCRLLNLVERQ